MEDFKDMKLLNIVRFAEYIVEHAEDFPQCLPLLKEAFQALSIAERKLECLKQSFIKHYKENRKKSSEAKGEEPDGNSTMVSMSSVTDYFTETEDGPPIKKKKNKKVSSVIVKSDSDANAGHLESHQPICEQSDFSPEHSTPNIKKRKKKKKKLIENSVDEEVKSMSPAPCVSPMDSKEELKFDETEENKEELLINTVSSVSCERDPLMPIRASSEAPTEASVSSRVSSMSPTKREKSICSNENSECSSAQVPTCTDHERPPQPIFCDGEPGSYIPTSAMPSASNRIGSPGLRVIPSALLMENPLQLDVQPPETNNSLCTPDVQMDGTSNPHGQGAVEPESSNSRNNRNVLYFEFSRDVDKRKWLEAPDVIMAIKQKDPMLSGCWITVDDMKRSSNIVSGYLIFPDVRSCLRVFKNGLRVNGFFARLQPLEAVGDPGSFSHPQPEPVGFASSPDAACLATSEPMEPASTDEMSPLLPRRFIRHLFFMERGRGRSRGWGERRGGRCGKVRGGGPGNERSGRRGGGHGDERGGGRAGGHGDERGGRRAGGHGDERGGRHGGGHGDERGGRRAGGHGDERGGGHGDERGGGRGDERGGRRAGGHGDERGGARGIRHSGGGRDRERPPPK